MKITFIGADHEVTGSCTFVECAGKKFLVDFGMEQGLDTFENAKIPCPPAQIDFVLLTHAHIDHSGLLPLLYAGGFKGEIHATEATCNLCSIMLRDSAHIQESEAEWKTRKARRKGEDEYQPLYDMNDAEGAIALLVPHKYEEILEIAPGVKVRFVDAGHLLGSASIEVWLTEGDQTRKIVFSGDIGNLDQPLIRDPVYIDDSDYVVMESTYGNRYHDRVENYAQRLAEIIKETFAKGGNLVIPSFAVGRTQEMLYFIRQIKAEGLASECGDFPVYVDSPLAIEATEIFNKNKNSCFDKEAMEFVSKGINPITFSNLNIARTSDESRAINFDNQPKVIISASGMCEAGRIKHHLKHNLWREESTILFVGYQALNTLGRAIVDGAKEVTIFGEKIAVDARVIVLPGVSGHADKNGLDCWIKHINNVKTVFVNHGEEQTAEEYKEHLKRDFEINAYAPYSGAYCDLISGKFVNAEPVRIVKKSSKGSPAYQRLVSALNRLSGIVGRSSGLTNKELAKLTDTINNLCSKWED